MLLEDDHHCFGCGMENPHGLRIKWKTEGLVTTAEFTPDRKFQGWKGTLHGGILATLLDEAMTRLASANYGAAVTAEITVRYVAPALIGEVILIRGEIVNDSSRIVHTKASLSDRSGKIIAHATGKIMKVRNATDRDS